MDIIIVIIILFLSITFAVNYYNIYTIEQFDENTNTINGLLKTTANLYKYVLLKKNPNIKSINYIKSHQDGSIINTEQADNAGEYYVKLNGGYLTTDKYNNYGITEKTQTDNEIFTIHNIYDNKYYYKSLLDIDSEEVDAKEYGNFGIIKSKVSGQCLTNEDSKISLELCRDTEKQRWSIINEVE